jgi:dienelactone hydrolase
MVDGPGQGSALYEKGRVFCHDYEAVFGAILDFPAQRCEVDRERIALSGRSFGGYLAPRAACFEHRARALITDPGLYDLGGQDVGEWGHCEAVALSRYDQVVHDWLDGVLAS